MAKLLIVDGNSLLFRAYYATIKAARMTTKDGTPTNAVFNFANMFQKAIDEIEPDAVMVAFDAGKHTFRHDIYPEYKGGRKETPEDLKPQFQLVRDMLDAMNVVWMEKPDIEADDLIGTTSKISDDYHTYILTNDKDMLQLIDDTTNVLLMKTGISEMMDMDEEKLMEVMEVTPAQIIDLKGLSGDKSDNIPGIVGVGDVTAKKLLKEYGDVENILAHADELKGALQTKVMEGKEDALLSKQLATIRRDIPLDFDLEDLKFHPNYKSLIQFLRALDMNKLSERFEKYLDEEDEDIVLPKRDVSLIQKVPKEIYKKEVAIFINDDLNHFMKAKVLNLTVVPFAKYSPSVLRNVA